MIADKLHRNPLMKDINYESIIDYSVECMRLINMPAIYISKVKEIEIKDYKGQIPFDMMYAVQMSLKTNEGLCAINYGEDTLHEHFKCYPEEANRSEGPTYTMNNSRVFTNFQEGTLVLTYRAIATDEECYPMVINNPKVLLAIEYYIRYRWYDILNDMGTISDRKLNKVETEYSWRVGQAQSDLVMPDLAEMEGLVNSITQILPSRTQYKNRFKHLQSQEFLKVQ